MPDIKRVVLMIIAEITRFVQSGSAPTVDYRPRTPGWFHAALLGGLFVFLGVMHASVTLVAGQVTGLSVTFALGAIALGSSLLWLASFLRPRP